MADDTTMFLFYSWEKSCYIFKSNYWYIEAADKVFKDNFGTTIEVIRYDNTAYIKYSSENSYIKYYKDKYNEYLKNKEKNELTNQNQKDLGNSL